jgi:peptide/nickel transport system permease protein
MTSTVRSATAAADVSLQATARARRSRRWLRSNRVVVGVIVLGAIALAIVVLPYLLPYEPQAQNARENFRPPLSPGSAGPHLLGTDALGRDLLARLLLGGQISLLVSCGAGLLSALVGVTLGLLAGYEGGWVDALIMRLVDVELAIPSILLAMGLMAAFGASQLNVVLALAITAWLVYARTVRSSVLLLRNSQFSEAARSLGASDLRVIVRHILPNCVTPIIVIATQQTAQLIIVESSLSFLGIGVPIEIPSWGRMIAEGRSYLTTSWWIITMPGLALMTTTLALNFFGDGLRDVLDPRLRI